MLLRKMEQNYCPILTTDSYKFSKKIIIREKKNDYFTVNTLYKHKYYYFFAAGN